MGSSGLFSANMLDYPSRIRSCLYLNSFLSFMGLLCSNKEDGSSVHAAVSFLDSIPFAKQRTEILAKKAVNRLGRIITKLIHQIR